jgi:hypothetical protein
MSGMKNESRKDRWFAAMIALDVEVVSSQKQGLQDSLEDPVQPGSLR